MKLETKRENLLKPLQHIVGVVERRQTLPILSNVLAVARDSELILTATDMEVTLSTRININIERPGEITLPARKLLDILRALPEEAPVSLAVDSERAIIHCGRSRFNLATLPAAGFPAEENSTFDGRVQLPQNVLRMLIEHTHFAMAQQDVRYYLNGLLLYMSGGQLGAVATDGHRLAQCKVEAAIEPANFDQQLIVPRKGIQELLRLSSGDDAPVLLNIGANQIQAVMENISFTSKLVDGKFPDYDRVIPQESEHVIVVDRIALRTALARAAILSSEKYRGVRLHMEKGTLRIQANNPEQEEAEEELPINFDDGPLEIGFNVTYLLDALGALSSDSVKIFCTDASSSCLLQEVEGESCKYVIMPMRL
jgi:DNA polymerase-3 subunit beta